MYNRTIPRPTSQTRDPASSRQVDRPPDITEQIDRENRHYYDGGGHGDVWRCIYHGTCGPVVVAVKTLRCIKGQETLQENLRRELGIWRRLNHPNIVPFLGIARGFGMRGSAALVSLWMPNGTLHVFLERNGVVLTIEDRLKILHGVASGLAYLHSFPIIHGDLTSSNVLVDEDRSARLVDFGLASTVGKLQAGMSYLQRVTRNPGAIRFAAPELVIQSETFASPPQESQASDVYSLGCIMLQVMTGAIPWAEAKTETQVMYKMMQGKKPDRPTCSELRDCHWVFIEKCWLPAPKRPTASETMTTISSFLLPKSQALGSTNTRTNNDDKKPARNPIPSPNIHNNSTSEGFTWAHRPPPEEIFPEHDLDAPAVEVNSTGTAAEPAYDILPNNRKKPTGPRMKRSIGIVAQEHTRRIDRPPEDIYNRLDEFFPELDLDKPVIEASSRESLQIAGTPPDDRKGTTGARMKRSIRIVAQEHQRRLDRPSPEEVYDRLEDFFAEHDLDKPVEAGLGEPSSTAAEHASGTLPSRTEGMRKKKSIRIVAEEHKKRLDRPSHEFLRHRSTKIWGTHVEPTTSQKEPTVDPSLPVSPGPIFKWVRGELIGKGTYSNVYLALNATTGEMIAVKQVEILTAADDKSAKHQSIIVQALKTESEMLKDLDHPHIVAYLGFEETPRFLSIFLEYVPGGSIESQLRNHGKFDEEVTKSFTSQILDGLAYLHSKNIIHRDLKADNILVEMTGICKISDFGVSKQANDGPMFTTTQGSVFWMAPEVFDGQKKGKDDDSKVDIWSVGCVVVEMWTGRRPWFDEDAFVVVYKVLREGKLPPIPADVVLTDLATDFKDRCFARHPDARGTAAELIQHPYLKLPEGWVFIGFK